MYVFSVLECLSYIYIYTYILYTHLSIYHFRKISKSNVCVHYHFSLQVNLSRKTGLQQFARINSIQIKLSSQQHNHSINHLILSLNQSIKQSIHVYCVCLAVCVWLHPPPPLPLPLRGSGGRITTFAPPHFTRFCA